MGIMFTGAAHRREGGGAPTEAQETTEHIQRLQQQTYARSAALFSAWLAAMLKLGGITQHAMAQELGVSEELISEWKSGERIPGPGETRALAKYFHEREAPAHAHATTEMKGGVDMSSDGSYAPFSAWLAAMIKLRGTTQRVIAREIGVNEGLISKWKSGERIPGHREIIALAGYFDVPLDRLMVTVTPSDLSPVEPLEIPGAKERRQLEALRRKLLADDKYSEKEVRLFDQALRQFEGTDDEATH